MGSEDPRIALSAGGRVRTAVVRWQHRRGGEAHCLVRLHLPWLLERLVAVVSEIRTNPEGRGIISDFPGVAAAVLRIVPTYLGVGPRDVIWVAHHGEFSYPDAQGSPEIFTRIEMRWDGEHYRDDLRWHHRMTPAEVAELLGDLRLAPVPHALAQLGWHF